MNVDCLCRQRLAAFGADHDGVKHLVAILVFVQKRSSARIDHVDVEYAKTGIAGDVGMLTPRQCGEK
jgi:hypothetical protein